jgi:hypothetical protein
LLRIRPVFDAGDGIGGDARLFSALPPQRSIRWSHFSRGLKETGYVEGRNVAIE